MNIRKTAARAAGVGAATVAALGLLSTGAANADTFVPLPGGDITQTLSDGTVVRVWMTDESATISPSMGSTPVHRNAWVSGTVHVEISGETTAKKGKIWPGYVVGCQVNIDGGGVSGGPNASVDWSGEQAEGNIGAGGGATLSLGPGQARSFTILDLEAADDYGNEDHSSGNTFNGHSGSISWQDSTIGLTGCGGYAQARSVVRVRVETDNVMSTVTLWGQPFSIG
ncbi:MspA family porin [Nocardia sp. CDC159]|uniref:MspA family porin n=1 Tax=Nocardia pulmonis TaxID=2951408 RepID=A0A9X2E7H9_9NOCA|nr:MULTISPECIES: MspA family porin [Nocardia]MCM6775174.1 MspA family porin [Nocardia pulmonis]MCM6789644.1 MspA family porin [Nocardia sp. CDC159]